MNLLERLYDRVIGRRVFAARVDVLCDHFAQLIPPAARVLDVGCGNGLLARRISQRRPDLSLHGIDVLIQPECDMPVEKYDGRVIPHPDGSFDVVLFVDILHHADDPMALLREGRRVARKAILIKDHPKDGFLAGPTLRFMDWVANARFGIPLPFHFWPRQRWLEAFRELGVSVGVWDTKLGLYRPAGWLFDRGLHFIARLDVPAQEPAQVTVSETIRPLTPAVLVT